MQNEYSQITDALVNDLRRFYLNSAGRKNAYTIHASHSDGDGVACMILGQLATKIVLDPDLYKASNITYVVVDNPSEIALDLRNAIDLVSRRDDFDAEHAVFDILITDIGNVNPEIFGNLGYPWSRIRFIILDHHQDIKGYSEGYNQYVNNTSCCSTKFFYNCIRALILDGSELVDILQLMDFDCVYNPDTHVYGDSDKCLCKLFLDNRSPLGQYVDAIDRYDTGKWGAIDGIATLHDQSITEQLFFKGFMQMNELQDYIDFKIRMFMCYVYGNYGPLVQAERVEESFIIKEFAELTRSIEICDRGLVHPSGTIHRVGDDKLVAIDAGLSIKLPEELEGARFKVLYSSEDEGEITYFSMISRHLLADESNAMDILVLVDHINKVVGLRSINDDFNCAKIATLNGGGGHIRAAGFPLVAADC